MQCTSAHLPRMGCPYRIRIFHIFIQLLLLTPCGELIAQADSASATPADYQPGDHELFLMPTAYTMESGGAYFSDYELFFLNFTYAPTPTTHVGVFTLFPITSDFLESATFGVKQNYLRSESVEGAVWGTFTIRNQLYSIGNVFSIGRKGLSFHAGLSLAGQMESSENILVIMAGGRADISRKLSAIVEYTNARELLDANFNGLISLGVRFRGESNAWELAGIRPLESTGKLLFLPFLKATFLF